MIYRQIQIVLWESERDHLTMGAALMWRPEDPAVVSLKMTQPDDGEEIVWQIARKMMAQALLGGKVGSMDVVIEAAQDTVFGHVLLLHLGNEREHTHFLLDRIVTARFLADTMRQVNSAQEEEIYMSMIDRDLAKLFL